MRKNIKLGVGLLTVLATPVVINTVDGNEVQAEYRGQVFYHLNKPANWWYSDGQDWYFFKDGRKYTGWGKDNAGEHYYVNGKYANGQYNGKNYVNGKEQNIKEGYLNNLFYSNNQLANWWYSDGEDWYFFQNGKKHTGLASDNSGEKYFANGKYANGVFEGRTYKDGKEVKSTNSIPVRGYYNGLYYADSKLANWWYDDGQDWYFFKDGKKHTGLASDNSGEKYFVNGKYANGVFEEKTYRDGKEVKTSDSTPVRGYHNGIYYVDNKPANWWYDDGKDWYFFKEGEKYTGLAKDNLGEHYYVNGKYANGEHNGKNYVGGKETKVIENGYSEGIFFADSKPANWWYDDGRDWYFFKEGKKYTGWGRDNAGEHYYVDGKYANGQYNGKNYVNGKIDTNTQPLNMPQYYQGDSRWGSKRYGLSTMRNTGCVPTSLAMAFSGLGKQVKPTDVADVIYYNTNEFNKREIGTSGRGAAYAIRHYGFNYSVIQSKEQLVQALQSGRPVFAAMANGYFVKGNYYTHAVVLSGYQNGKTKAMDPDNAYTTGKWYDVNNIWNQRSFEPSDTVMGGSFMMIGNN